MYRNGNGDLYGSGRSNDKVKLLAQPLADRGYELAGKGEGTYHVSLFLQWVRFQVKGTDSNCAAKLGKVSERKIKLMHDGLLRRK